jgi:hypothetical protein
MFLLLLVLLEVVLLGVTIHTLHLTYFWTLTSLALYGIISWYRQSPLTGYDTFEGLRSLPMWQWLIPLVRVRYAVADEKDFVKAGRDEKFIFVVLPNPTNTVLIWGFGFHGNASALGNLKLCYLLPAVLFWVPGLREVLLWSGAVSYQNVEDQTERVIEMTRLGRNVAYCPNGMQDALYVEEEKNTYGKRPDMALFKVACERNYQLVPCICSGENDERFIFVSNERIRSIQSWFLRKINYPFPLIFFPDRRGTRIEITVGSPIQSRGKTPEQLQQAFFKDLQALNNNGADKELILKD